MDDDSIRAYRRWHELEEAGREEDADRAFDALFKAAVAPVPVSRAFTADTMAAVSIAAARDVRRARRVRHAAIAGGVAGGAAATYFGASYVFAAVSAVFVRLIDVLVFGVLYLAAAMESGADMWSIAASLGRAMAAVASDPRVAVALVVIQAVAIAAFVALRRLLDSDLELSK